MKAIKLLFCLFAVALVSGCEDDNGYKYFDVKNESALEQTVYAGETQAPMPIEFTASGAWTSSIEYSTNGSASARADASSSGWITLDPDRGEAAGDYSVNIYLDPDKGEDVYMAVISFICNGEVLEVRIENSHSLNPGQSEDVNDPKKIEAAKQKLYDGFQSVEDAFLELDNDYSTPEDRKQLDSSSKLLEDFWYDSYDAINTCNLLLVACEQDVITEYEKDKILTMASVYRGIFHFYLSTIFGNVPVQADYPSDLKAPRALQDEVMDFVIDGMYRTEEYMNASSYHYDDVYLIRTLASVLRDETFLVDDNAGNYLRDAIDKISIDINEDGIVEIQECKDYPVPLQCNLLSAYIEAEDDLQYAMGRLGYIAEELNDDSFKVEASADAEDVRRKVESLLSGEWGKGMKYLVNRYMNSSYDWEDYLTHLPLPMKALEENENLEQNVGWY